jgi:hypothetical protein
MIDNKHSKADESLCHGSRHRPHAIFSPHQKSSSFSKTYIKNIVSGKSKQ